MGVIAGFTYDLFVSYAHNDNVPWTPGAEGWVTAFVRTLENKLKAKNREFRIWFDPALRTADDFNLAIAQAISQSAVFLAVLSPAYDISPYCKKELGEFRKQSHPSFGLTVGTMRRMQAMVLEPVQEERWPAEVRSTSPFAFYNADGDRLSRPKEDDETSPYVQGLRKVRNSIWDVLELMREQKEKGTVIEQSYSVPPQDGQMPAVLLAEVTDDLYYKREELRSALGQAKAFEVRNLEDAAATRQSSVLPVHLLGKVPGRPSAGQPYSLPRLQLEQVLSAGPARRPLVWLPRDVQPEDGETEAHKEFLRSLLEQRGIELVRMGFEDLKEDIQKRMQPGPAAVAKGIRRAVEDPIVHIWHSDDNPSPLAPLRLYLKQRNCGISVYRYAAESPEKLQSKLAFCDGLIISYTADNKAWAEDVMMKAFQLRRREERPLAYAALQLPPPGSSGDFNFEHPRVVAVQDSGSGLFQGMDSFLEQLEDCGACD